MKKKMTTDQTKLVYYTMRLDLKAREFHDLCEELEQLKKTVADPNDEAYVRLKERFEKNQKEIRAINAELKKLNSDGE